MNLDDLFFGVVLKIWTFARLFFLEAHASPIDGEEEISKGEEERIHVPPSYSFHTDKMKAGLHAPASPTSCM